MTAPVCGHPIGVHVPGTSSHWCVLCHLPYGHKGNHEIRWYGRSPFTTTTDTTGTWYHAPRNNTDYITLEHGPRRPTRDDPLWASVQRYADLVDDPTTTESTRDIARVLLHDCQRSIARFARIR